MEELHSVGLQCLSCRVAVVKDKFTLVSYVIALVACRGMKVKIKSVDTSKL